MTSHVFTVCMGEQQGDITLECKGVWSLWSCIKYVTSFMKANIYTPWRLNKISGTQYITPVSAVVALNSVEYKEVITNDKENVKIRKFIYVYEVWDTYFQIMRKPLIMCDAYEKLCIVCNI